MPSNVEILNSVREAAPNNYRDMIPEASRVNMAEIGRMLLDYQPAYNEFTQMLAKFALTIINSKMLRNRLAGFKQGKLEAGSDIEELFVNEALALAADPDGKRTLERFKPDISIIYHRLNFTASWPATVSRQQIQTAFHTSNGIENLINDIINSPYSSFNNAEYLNTKQIFWDYNAEGKFLQRLVPNVTNKDTAAAFLREVMQASLDIQFNATYYNAMHVLTYTDLEDQVLILHKDIVKHINVDMLSGTFNMGRADIQVPFIVVDDFGTDPDGGNPDNTLALLLDKEWFRIFDNWVVFEPPRNAQGIFDTYWLNVAQTYSASGFKNAIRFSFEP